MLGLPHGLATGWTYEVASSWLAVSEILFDETHGGWSTVALTQEFAPLGDLMVNLDLAWDSGGSNTAMQNISLGLYDTNDENAIWAIYHDAWDTNRGRLELRFQVGAWPTATFGEMSVDLISCEGEETTPTAGSTWGNIKALYR